MNGMSLCGAAQRRTIITLEALSARVADVQHGL